MNENNQTNFTKQIAKYYNKLYWLTFKSHNTADSIGFIKKALYAHVPPKFAQFKAHSMMKKNTKLIGDDTEHISKHLKLI